MYSRRGFYSLLLVFIIGLLQTVCADTVVHDDTFIPDAILHVSEKSVKQSCVPEKDILVVNGTSPGPKLEFVEGQTIWIRVFNDVADQNLTMHWHGLTLATAPFSDGTPQAAQWPIPPLHYFDYELHVPIGMAGTYFYHSHVGFQAISVTGPLIVEEANGKPPFNYDGDRIILLQDVYPDTDHFIEAALTSVPMAYERAQSMVLINGKAGGIPDTQILCNESLTVIDVEPGKTYRIRFIGGTAGSLIKLAFEDHELEVIEADSQYTEGYNTSYMQVGPGQRFSALLHTHTNPTKQFYYLQAEPRDFGAPEVSYAILNYGPSSELATSPKFYPPPERPLTLGDTDYEFLDYVLRPHNSYAHNDFPTAEEVTRRVNITSYLTIPHGELVYYINGFTWQERFVAEPYLVSLYKNDEDAFPDMERAMEHDGLDPVTYAFPARMGEVLEIVLQLEGSEGNNMESHPWHAHGSHYWDLGSGQGVYNRTANELRWKNSLGKPILRDTTMLYRWSGSAPRGKLASWRAWRLRVTQPGVWMIHCHLLPHMVWGMQTAWVMGNRSEVLSLPLPQVQGYLEFGGSVNGNSTHPPEVVEYFPLPIWADGDGQ